MSPLIGPRGPRGRGRRLIDPLRTLSYVTIALAAVGALMQGQIGLWAAGLTVGFLLAIPFGRVLFLTGRWWQIGDTTFAVRGSILLGVLIAAMVVGLQQ